MSTVPMRRRAVRQACVILLGLGDDLYFAFCVRGGASRFGETRGSILRKVGLQVFSENSRTSSSNVASENGAIRSTHPFRWLPQRHGLRS